MFVVVTSGVTVPGITYWGFSLVFKTFSQFPEDPCIHDLIQELEP